MTTIIYERMDGEQTAHRWLQIAGADLLPAVREQGLPLAESLKALPWTGETPCWPLGDGKVYRVAGWPAYVARPSEVRQWVNEGLNLLLNTRHARGIKLIGPDAVQRFRRLREGAEDYLGKEFHPPVVVTPESVTLFCEVQTAGLACRTSKDGRLQMLGDGGLALVHGLTATGGDVLTFDDPETWGPPSVTPEWWRDLWVRAGGERFRGATQHALQARRFALTRGNPVAGMLEREGWVLGANEMGGLDIRCPFHPNAARCAQFTPGEGRRGDRIDCPMCAQQERKALSEYLIAMGLTERETI